MTPKWRAILRSTGELDGRLRASIEHASGAYAIREAASGRVVYVGESHRGRMWKTMLRHFQAPESFRKVRETGVFASSPAKYEIAVWITSKGTRSRASTSAADQAAMRAQADWIALLDPVRNKDDGFVYDVVELPGEDEDPWGGLVRNPSKKKRKRKKKNPSSDDIRALAKNYLLGDDDAWLVISDWSEEASVPLPLGTNYVPFSRRDARLRVPWMTVERWIAATTLLLSEEWPVVSWLGLEGTYQALWGATKSRVLTIAEYDRIIETKARRGALSEREKVEIVEKRGTRAMLEKDRASPRKRRPKKNPSTASVITSAKAYLLGDDAAFEVMADELEELGAFPLRDVFYSDRGNREGYDLALHNDFEDPVWRFFVSTMVLSSVDLPRGKLSPRWDERPTWRYSLRASQRVQFMVFGHPGDMFSREDLVKIYAIDDRRWGAWYEYQWSTSKEREEIAKEQSRRGDRKAASNPAGSQFVELGRLVRLTWKGGSHQWALGKAPSLAVERGKLAIVYPVRARKKASPSSKKKYADLHWGEPSTGASEAIVPDGPFVDLGPGVAITYATRKGSGDVADWEHIWGDGAKSKWTPPIVAKQKRGGGFALRGGTYHVTEQGIVG